MQSTAKEKIVTALYEAVRDEELDALQSWREEHADATLIAHDYPEVGEQTLVYPADLRVYLGSNSIQIGFDTAPDSREPMTLADIGRLSVVHFVEFDWDNRLEDVQ